MFPLGPQALIIKGPKEDTKRYALSYAKELLGKNHIQRIEEGQHPDVFLFGLEEKNHPVASIRKILEEANFPPFEAPFKVYIIEDAEKMLPTSSNALLKTLEEPFPRSKFLLLTQSPEEILPTISSRCIAITLESHGISPQQDPLLSYFTQMLQRFFLEPITPPLLESFDHFEKKWEEDRKIEPFIEEFVLWVRDLHAVSCCEEVVIHQGYKEDLLRQASKKIPSLEKAMLLAEEALLAFERSVKPKAILEHLFFNTYNICQATAPP